MKQSFINRQRYQELVTYILGRSCHHCKEPISDQEHAARIFCTRRVFSDGSVKNCKDDYWAEIRKNESDIYKKMERYHKETSARLQYLYDLNLPEITHDILDNVGIYLSRCINRKQENNDLLIFYFIGYAISVHPITNRIKIFQHDAELF